MTNQDTLIITGLQSTPAERVKQEKGLYNMYAYFIEEGCRKYNLDYDDSFSAYSDAVLATIRNITANHFDGHSTLKTYLYQIFSNKCIDLVRKNTTNKQQVHQTLPQSDLLNELPDAARSMVERLMDEENRRAIKQQLMAIGEKCREILLLFEEGFTDKQIAAALHYNSPAVAKTTRLRCLEKLRGRL